MTANQHLTSSDLSHHTATCAENFFLLLLINSYRLVSIFYITMSDNCFNDGQLLFKKKTIVEVDENDKLEFLS